MNSRSIRTSIAVFGFSLLSSFLLSQSVRAESQPYNMSLSSAVAIARENSAAILLARERKEQAKARSAATRSALLPQLTATAYQYRQVENLESRGFSIPRTSPLIGPYNTFDARLRITQTLFDRTTYENFKASKSSARMFELEAAKAVEDELALTGILYINAKRAFESKSTARIVLKRDQEQYNVSSMRLKQGVSTSADVAQVEAKLNVSRNQVFEAEKMAAQRVLDLLAALALPLDRMIVFRDNDQSFDKTVPTENEVLAAVEKLPELQIAAVRLEETQSLLSSAKSITLPKVVASADYGSSGNTPSESQPTYQYGAQVNFPLYTGGQRNSRVAEQESQIRAAQIQLDDLRRRSQAAALAARQTLQQAIELLDVRVSQRSAAEKHFRVSRSRVKAGFADSLEALDAQAQSAIARDQWQEAWATYQTARINLAHSMGLMENMEKL